MKQDSHKRLPLRATLLIALAAIATLGSVFALVHFRQTPATSPHCGSGQPILVLLSTESPGIVAFDPSTHKQLWTNKDVSAVRLVQNCKIYSSGPDNEELVVVSADTGKTLWTATSPTAGMHYDQQFAVGNNVVYAVYAGHGNISMCGYDPQTGKRRWCEPQGHTYTELHEIGGTTFLEVNHVIEILNDQGKIVDSVNLAPGEYSHEIVPGTAPKSAFIRTSQRIIEAESDRFVRSYMLPHSFQVGGLYDNIQAENGGKIYFFEVDQKVDHQQTSKTSILSFQQNSAAAPIVAGTFPGRCSLESETFAVCTEKDAISGWNLAKSSRLWSTPLPQYSDLSQRAEGGALFIDTSREEQLLTYSQAGTKLLWNVSETSDKWRTCYKFVLTHQEFYCLSAPSFEGANKGVTILAIDLKSGTQQEFELDNTRSEAGNYWNASIYNL